MLCTALSSITNKKDFSIISVTKSLRLSFVFLTTPGLSKDIRCHGCQTLSYTCKSPYQTRSDVQRAVSLVVTDGQNLPFVWVYMGYYTHLITSEGQLQKEGLNLGLNLKKKTSAESTFATLKYPFFNKQFPCPLQVLHVVYDIARALFIAVSARLPSFYSHLLCSLL